MLECVVNISEGCDEHVLRQLSSAAGSTLLDTHSDCWHHRSVFTLAGEGPQVAQAARNLARRALELLDLCTHQGAHPRLGVVDVVPFVGLGGWPLGDIPGASAPGGVARAQRDAFARWAAAELGLAVYMYGPERSLPELRRMARSGVAPDLGPAVPSREAGAVAVGCRPAMVAYNLWLSGAELAQAQAIAAAVRRPGLRALAFALGGDVQLSFNLVDPFELGPVQVMGLVMPEVSAIGASVARAELVGLAPMAVLQRVPRPRWAELGLSEGCTIEARLEDAGLRPLATGR